MENKIIKVLFEVNKKTVLVILMILQLDKEKAKRINKNVSRKRIKVGHCFASLKSYKVLTKPLYWTRKNITMFVKVITNLINLPVELKKLKVMGWGTETVLHYETSFKYYYERS